MDYTRVYSEFIEDRRRLEDTVSVGERHHIIPKHLGGGNEPGNLIRLSLPDHLFAHLLLGKIHGGRLAQCYLRMSGMRKYSGGRATRTRFASLRAAARETLISGWTPERRARRSEQYKASPEKTHGPGWSEKTSAALKGRKPSAATIEASRKSKTGVPLSEQHKAKLRAARAGKTPALGLRHTDETKRKMRAARVGKKPMLGRKHTDETKRKMSLAHKARHQQI